MNGRRGVFLGVLGLFVAILLASSGRSCCCSPPPPTPKATDKPTPTDAPEELGKVELEATTVWHQHHGETKHELAGTDSLYDEDGVWTDAFGVAWLDIDDVTMKVYWDGKQTVRREGADAVEFAIENGTALYGMGGDTQVSIKAGRAVIEAVGTLFSVSYRSDLDTALLRTIDGVARIGNSRPDGTVEAWREVAASQWSTVAEGRRPSTARSVSMMGGILERMDLWDVMEQIDAEVSRGDFAVPGEPVLDSGALETVPPRDTGGVTLVLMVPQSLEGDVSLIENETLRFAQQTGVGVEVQLYEDAEKLSVMAAAGSSDLDVVLLDMSRVPALASIKALVPLEGPVERLDVDLGDFFSGPLAACTYQGDLVALPWAMDVNLLYYRQDILEELGYAAPRTYDELLSVSAEVIELQRVPYGYVWAGGSSFSLSTMLAEHVAAYGGEIVTVGGEVVVANREAIDGLEQMARYVETGASPPAVVEWRENDLIDIFRGQRVALFMRNWTYAWRDLNEPGSEVEGAVGVVPLPENVTGMWTNGLGVWGYSQHQEEAAWLVSFLTDTDQQVERAVELGRNPARRSVYEWLPDGWEPFGTHTWVVYDASEGAVALPSLVDHGQMVQILAENTQLVLVEEFKPEEAAEVMMDALSRLVP